MARRSPPRVRAGSAPRRCGVCWRSTPTPTACSSWRRCWHCGRRHEVRLTPDTRAPMHIVIIGLSITSSWGNGHATTYRALARHLAARGHDVVFLERDVPWYAENRDMPEPPGARTYLYASLDELRRSHEGAVRDADIVVVGSYVPEGIAVGEWVTSTASKVTAFYD